ncbi:MAG: GntR family transcriptional regulator [Chelatococcus sp.]|uniref:GntR family transcriptional regulator n=1 Tax=unclassified Chelatococcus TaxID=2638111 RepID=UPI001BD0A6A4|nr:MULTISPECIES: GntR family transcriptional regulator [unclassified Chelatococcus]CAH1657415.1 GntR family transcriptional regulator [Hyphomicrobiales bacterium]MBS7742313.1 GntR family transcriptional regulator [Chelatococcus sp. HY11]MBX3538380.1 GntR family transcriptional regulator [Chelatococcus sp.]MBX3542569.1 GntR family transcriptional regulator [Chelatococcus sp.]MCO5075214.1 GntR family transcriptional regulator [Chelatococcus sp.]
MTRTSAKEGSSVNANLKAPLYHQIFLILRDGILGGTFKVGDVLPAEHEVASLYGVSRITARRALTELALAGLVSRARGRGTIVKYRPPTPPLRASVAAWLEGATVMGQTTTVKVIEFGYGPATQLEAEALELPAGTEVQHSQRVRYFGDFAISLLVTVIPARIGRTFDRTGLARTPMLSLIKRSGVKIGHARQSITATLADQNIATRLSTEIGAPLLKVQRVVSDHADEPIEYLTAYYRPDRYQLEMVLSPSQTVETMSSTLSELTMQPAEAKNGKR